MLTVLAASDLVRLWWQRPLAPLVPGSSLHNRYSQDRLSLEQVARFELGDRGHVVQGQ